MSEKRRGQLKKGTLLDSHQKRREATDAVRTTKRESAYAKRRKLTTPADEGADADLPGWTAEELSDAIRGLSSSEVTKLLPALQYVRKTLQQEDPPVEQVVEAGAVRVLIGLLDNRDDRVKIEATLSLSLVAASHTHHTNAVVDSAPRLISFLSAQHHELQENALWALGNIAADSKEFRDRLEANGAILPVARLMQAVSASADPKDVELARVAGWALSNLARGTQVSAKPFYEAGAFPTLVALLQHPNDNVAGEAAWTLTFLLAREDEYVDKLLELGVVGPLVDLFMKSKAEVALCTPVVRSLGNLAAGPHAWLEALLGDARFLPAMQQLLASIAPDQGGVGGLVKEALWTLSNVAAGGPESRELVVRSGMVPDVIKFLRFGTFEPRKEAAHVLINMAMDDRYLGDLAAAEGVLQNFVLVLKVPVSELVRVALTFVSLVCEKLPQGPQMVEKHHGMEALDELHYGPVDEDISKGAAYIMDQYFGDDYPVSEDELARAPDMSAAPHFEERHPTMGRGKELTKPAWMPSAMEA